VTETNQAPAPDVAVECSIFFGGGQVHEILPIGPNLKMVNDVLDYIEK
jgi:hypothetical protein